MHYRKIKGRGLTTLNLLDLGWLLRGGAVNRLVEGKCGGAESE